jgi:hypothetical protein
MNLFSITAGAAGAVNPRIPVCVRSSAGNAVGADGSVTPAYADPVVVLAQVQALSGRDLRQVEGLNLQGTLRTFYFNGTVDGVVRVTAQGGDLITTPDGNVWLVTLVPEPWELTAGWCKVIATLQNGS